MFNLDAISRVTQSPSSNLSRQGVMGKQEFLQLLVAQLRHQDPLSPLQSQEFASQLAQFTSLEQLTNIDNSLQYGMNIDMLLTQAVSNSLAANFIGKQASTLGNTVSLASGENTELPFHLAGYAETVKINITNDVGEIVRTLEVRGLPSGSHAISWDGKDMDGKPLSDGVYQFEVQAVSKDGNFIDTRTYTRGIVQSVRYINGAARLVVNGREIAIADVMEIG